MQSSISKRTRIRQEIFDFSTIFRVALLVVPAILLLIAGFRAQGASHDVYLLGAGFQALICTLGLLTRTFLRQPLSSTVLMVYSLGLAWLFVGDLPHDWFYHLTQAVLLVVPLTLLGIQTLTETGAPTVRRARVLARRLASKRDWPRDLEKCRVLPEVKAFREALYLDATPALDLLRDSRPAVQMAALSALEFRTYWQRGQAETVLHLALRADEPAVRAAALSALANVEDHYIIESLAEFLRDPSTLVRQAAVESLLWSTETRWGWIRHAVRRSLADPLCQDDGPLRHHGEPLAPMAVEDLTAWSTESGLVGMRASASLATHYAQTFQENPDPVMKRQLQKIIEDPRAPAVLRIELARTLKDAHVLETDLLRKLLDPGNPAPLRLLSAEALLEREESDEAVLTLRFLARLPNREIAVATADVIQRQFQVQLGLVPGEPLPPLHSRQATEISRRVMAWAEEEERADREERQFASQSTSAIEASGTASSTTER